MHPFIASGLLWLTSPLLLAEVPHDRSVFFDNAPAGDRSWFSEGTTVGAHYVYWRFS